MSTPNIDLGVLYTRGQGVKKDEREAAKWYRKAAEQNIAGAQYSLGAMYASRCRCGEGRP